MASFLAQALSHGQKWPRFKVFLDPIGRWRWRLVAITGKTIAECGEGFGDKDACLSSINVVKATDATTPVVFETE